MLINDTPDEIQTSFKCHRVILRLPAEMVKFVFLGEETDKKHKKI